MADLRFTKHALERMFERNISPSECEEIFQQERTIEAYPDDEPFPSELRFGQVGDKMIHLVVAFTENAVHVLTDYEPDPTLWDEGFTKRKKG